MDGLKARYYGELMAEAPGTLTGTAAHAKLQALESIRADIDSFIMDEKFRTKGK